ncbi:MAG: FmdE family protein [Desulfurispora sp.]|uniref:FmdE family protein n=1 Tax=Desulfurispora sp. TaxID=3014275 RepID=UPI0040491ED4
MNQAGKKIGEEAQKQFPRGKNLLVLTNAGYAQIAGQTTLGALEGIRQATGCSEGLGNLLRVHSASTRPLWFFFFEPASGEGLYCEVNSAGLADLIAQNKNSVADLNKLISKKAKENVAAAKLLANPAAWDKKVQEKIFNGLEFALVTIANGVARGAPPELVQSMLFHDHYCPGVTSGYFIARYLQNNFPLRDGESYYIIALPPWCKDDALQVMLNTTPGKNGMAVLPLKDRSILADAYKSMAGVYFRYNSKTQKGEGVVLSFDFNKIKELTGVDTGKGYPWETRLKADLLYLPYVNKPELFVQVLKKFELAPNEEPQDYVQPGVNPLTKLGLLKWQWQW